MYIYIYVCVCVSILISIWAVSWFYGYVCIDWDMNRLDRYYFLYVFDCSSAPGVWVWGLRAVNFFRELQFDVMVQPQPVASSQMMTFNLEKLTTCTLGQTNINVENPNSWFRTILHKSVIFPHVTTSIDRFTGGCTANLLIRCSEGFLEFSRHDEKWWLISWLHELFAVRSSRFTSTMEDPSWI